MTAVTRKSLAILLGIGDIEAAPYAMILDLSSRAGITRLYVSHGAIWPAWVAAAVVTAAYVVHAVRALPLVRVHFFDLTALKLVALPFALVTGTMEELWFRRMLMDWAARHGGSAVLQVLASALVFGLAHGVWGLFGRQWRVAVGACVATGLLGALLGIVYLLGGRQLAPCVWAHMLINLAIEPWLIVSAVAAGTDSRRPGRPAAAATESQGTPTR
jgi:hypothetical protein